MTKGDFPDWLNADGTPKRGIMDERQEGDDRQQERRAEDQHTKDVMKEAIKEATTEWLNKQFLAFGKWTAIGLISIALATVMYMIASFPGFKQALGQALTTR